MLKTLSVPGHGRGLLIPNPGEESKDPQSVLVAFHKNGKWVIAPINVDSIKRQLTKAVLHEYGYSPEVKNGLEALMGLLGYTKEVEKEKPSLETVLVEFKAISPAKRDEVEAYFDATVDEGSKELFDAFKVLSKYYS